MISTYTYAIGQIIHHRQYGYRGVVVTADARCAAPDEWYLRNRTQPDRDQPWYHVLTDGGDETYVAEENLELDSSGAPVNHPLIPRLFPTFSSGRYYQDSFN